MTRSDDDEYLSEIPKGKLELEEEEDWRASIDFTWKVFIIGLIGSNEADYYFW